MYKRSVGRIFYGAVAITTMKLRLRLPTGRQACLPVGRSHPSAISSLLSKRQMRNKSTEELPFLNHYFNYTIMFKLVKLVSLFIIFIASTGINFCFAQQLQERRVKNELLLQANMLLRNINQQNTEYQHKGRGVSWGDDGNNVQCFTDCSGFMNALFSKAYHYNEPEFYNLWGHKHMFAYHYFDAIASGNHFHPIQNIRDVQPGDIIAIKYADRSEHDDNTGHVLLIAGRPSFHKPSKIFLPNTIQYEIEIIDCSKSPHGKTDSRFLPDGNEYSGLGRGIFRLYTDMQGKITAYSWSTGNPKEGFDPYENPIIIGRYF